MSTTRTTATASLLALALLGAACEMTVTSSLLDGNTDAALQQPDGIDPSNPNVERSSMWLDFEGIDTIRIELPTGRVSVSQALGDVGGSLKITEFIVVEGISHEVLGELHNRTKVTAERSFVDHARLDIEASIPASLADTDVVFDLRLVVPHGASVEVLLANGPVEVTDITGNVEIRTANGAITLEHIDGNVVAETSERSIEASDISGNVQARTTGADITLRLAPPPEGRISARTTGGSIFLTVPDTTGAALELSAPGGVVSADLGGFTVSEIITGDGFLGGILNDGSGRIEAEATGGEVNFAGM